MKKSWFAFVVIAGVWTASAAVQPINKLSPTEQRARIQSDARAVQVYREGLRMTLDYVHQQTNLFPAAKLPQARLMRREDKEAVWSTWRTFLDYMVALDAVGQYHQPFYLLKGEAFDGSFLTHHAVTVAQYRFAMKFIERAENDAGFDSLLNEPVPEVGLPANSYAQLKFRFLNVARATEFGAQRAIDATIRQGREPALRKIIQEDAEKIWQMGKGKGEIQTAKNGLNILRRTGNALWFPVQAGVSEWMGDTKVARIKQSLISPEQIKQLTARLQPGDILLERREWYLSNVGLPGYWPHAALYIGTAEQRRKFFDDPEVRNWVRSQEEAAGDFESLLQARYPGKYAAGLQPQEHEHGTRVIEAISEGVSFTSIEHSADCDSLAVLRPRNSKREKAQAVLRAFHYLGRPYDFNFDFATDDTLVCTELVFKAYEPGSGLAGLTLPVVETLGRKVTPANEIVRQFDTQFGTTAQQTDLVLFLDGHERDRKAVETTVMNFRESWKRPKWHILSQSLKKNP